MKPQDVLNAIDLDFFRRQTKALFASGQLNADSPEFQEMAAQHYYGNFAQVVQGLEPGEDLVEEMAGALRAEELAWQLIQEGNPQGRISLLEANGDFESGWLDVSTVLTNYAIRAREMRQAVLAKMGKGQS